MNAIEQFVADVRAAEAARSDDVEVALDRLGRQGAWEHVTPALCRTRAEHFTWMRWRVLVGHLSDDDGQAWLGESGERGRP